MDFPAVRQRLDIHHNSGDEFNTGEIQQPEYVYFRPDQRPEVENLYNTYIPTSGRHRMLTFEERMQRRRGQ